MYLAVVALFTLDGLTRIFQPHVMLFLYSVSLMLICPSGSVNISASPRHPEANQHERIIVLFFYVELYNLQLYIGV